MRFLADGPDIPDELLYECDKGNVVFLCGAGVSMPSGLPSFSKLTQLVAAKFDPDPNSNISLALKPWIENDPKIPPEARVSFDQIFNLIYSRIPENKVNDYIKDILNGYQAETWPHEVISKLSANDLGQAQIVTTNFDTLFEKCGFSSIRFEPPLLPNLGHRNTSPVGITYLHGRLVDSDDKQPNYVLSSSDFGRAYLAEGWATSYIRQLLINYYVVMIGYSAEDPPVKYLLQGLDSSPSHESSKLYVFDAGTIEEVKEKWMGRGVTPIAYSWSREHHHLWETLRSWSQRKQNPPLWRQSVISMAKVNPKDLTPHERGKVLHLVRHPVGMKEFADAEVSPDPEWICVFDVRVRYGKPYKPYDFEDERKLLDPMDLYGIDSDQKVIDFDKNKPRWHASSLDILRTQIFDERMDENARFSAGFYLDLTPISGRFTSLSKWLLKNLKSPVTLWWFARQGVLLPAVKTELKRELWAQSSNLDEGMYKSWEILIDSYEGSEVSRPIDWFRYEKHTSILGWNAVSIKQLDQLLTPHYKIDLNHGELVVCPRSLELIPTRLPLLQVCKVGIELPHCKSLDDFPDMNDEAIGTVVYTVLKCLDTLINMSSYADIYIDKSFSFEEGEGWDGDIEKISRLFIEILCRLEKVNPRKVFEVLSLVDSKSDDLLFRISMAFWNNKEVYFTDTLNSIFSSISYEDFWVSCYRDELFIALRDRWEDLEDSVRSIIEKWLLTPRPNWNDQKNEVYETRKFDRAIIAISWLKKHGVVFSADFSREADRLLIRMPDVLESVIDNFIGKSNSWPIMSGSDESYDYFDDVEDCDLIDKIVSYSKDRNTFDFQFKPFIGIVKNDPERALRSLLLNKDAPIWIVGQLLTHLPLGIRVDEVLNYIYRLPNDVIYEIRYRILEWIDLNNDTLVNELGFNIIELYKWLISKLLECDRGAFSSSIIDTSDAEPQGEIYAINSISGRILSNLLKISENYPVFKDITNCIEKLLSISGEASDHAVYICCSNLGFLLEKDLDWVKDNLIFYFSINNRSARSAWYGLLLRNHPKWIAPVWNDLKFDFLKIPSVISDWSLKGEWVAPYEWLIFSCSKGEYAGVELSVVEAKFFISQLTDSQRAKLITRFRIFLKDDSSTQEILEFLKDCWPFDKGGERSGTSVAWLNLLMAFSSSKRELYSLVKEELHPIKNERFSLFEMYHTHHGHTPMANNDPVMALDILYRVIIKDTPRHILDEVRTVLHQVKNIRPELEKNSRYVRLLEIVSGVQ